MRVRLCDSLGFLTLAVVGALLGVTADAHAQAWLSDRKRAEGSGIRLGDFELHPGIGAEVGYISNVFNADKNLQSSGALRLAPHLMLSTIGEERAETDQGDAKPGMIEFRGGVSGSLLTYFAKAAPGTVVGTNADFELTIAPHRPVSFALNEQFGRTAQPFTEPGLASSAAAAKKIEPPNYARDQENIGAKLMLETPGGLLKSSLGYRFGFDFFEDSDFQANNNLSHNVNMDANWEFLPKTALFWDAGFTNQHYTKKAAVATVQHVDSNSISTRMGLNGAITSRVSATVAGGYTAGFSKDDNDYEGINANAELRYDPAQDVEVAAGYDRSLSTAFQGGHQTRDRIFLRSRAMFGGAAVINGKVGIEFIKFGVDPIQGGRKDRRWFADLSGEYRFVDWLAGTGQVGLVVDDTAFAFKAAPGSPPGTPTDPAKYTSVEAWAGLRAFY
jgi:hypothetical protein